MSLRRQIACEFNLVALKKGVKQLYMWTPTFPFFARPESVRDQTRQLIQWFNRHGATGVRVYEMHKSGSLHLHIVLDKALWVGDVRSFWQSIGGGGFMLKFSRLKISGSILQKNL